MLTDKKEIIDFLNEYFHIYGRYTISDDGVIDITNGSIEVKFEKFNKDGFTELPIQFGYIENNFNFDNANITTLKGFPHFVGHYLSIDHCVNLEYLIGSPQCKELHCNECFSLKSLDGLNCEVFYGFDIYYLKEIGNNFNANYFSFTEFPNPTTEEMKKLIKLNPELQTKQKAPWVTLIKDYFEHKDLLRAISEFEELYNEPWVKPEDKIEIINSDLTMSL